MPTFSKQKLILAASVTLLIFGACSIITFSNLFKQHPNELSVGILGDLLIVSPLVYYFIIRKSTISKLTVLRVFTLGLFVASIILTKQHNTILEFIKTWVTPLLELALVAYIIWKFHKFRSINKNQTHFDFLIHTRLVLASVFSNKKVANVIASEIAVFYYLFHKKSKNISLQFTSYKENGIIIVLYTFLFICLLETVVMHFVFALWNTTAAWIISGLSAYTCLQLLAHIRAISCRQTLVTENQVILSNGLLGGDVELNLSNIDRIESSSKDVVSKKAISMAFLKLIENHNTIIYIKEEVIVTKAFGINKSAKIILANIDESEKFIATINNKIN